jgi:hypothetical protein
MGVREPAIRRTQASGAVSVTAGELVCGWREGDLR